MKQLRYKQTGMIGLFDKEATSTKLSKLGNPLEKLHKAIDFEIFRPLLENHLLNQTRMGKAGCKPYDAVMVFKLILLKRFYNLSDGQAEYRINDRLSFKEFLAVTGAEVHDSQPAETLPGKEYKGQELYADSACIGEPIAAMLKGKEIIPQIIERGFKT